MKSWDRILLQEGETQTLTWRTIKTQISSQRELWEGKWDRKWKQGQREDEYVNDGIGLPGASWFPVGNPKFGTAEGAGKSPKQSFPFGTLWGVILQDSLFINWYRNVWVKLVVDVVEQMESICLFPNLPPSIHTLLWGAWKSQRCTHVPEEWLTGLGWWVYWGRQSICSERIL